MTEPRILLFDIETMAAKVYTWGYYQTNVIATDEDWYMLSVAYKWVGDNEVSFIRKAQAKGNDHFLVEKLWQLFDQADILVAHNGDSFDVKMATARFFELGMGPPSPYLTIDTKKVLAKVTRNYSNKLDEISRRLDFGRKLDTLGFNTWLGCARNDPEAWERMEEYNIHDVVLLERLYQREIPWIDTVNMSLWSGMCKRCGRGTKFGQWRGYYRTNASEFPMWQCQKEKGGCGGYSRRTKREKEAATR